MTDLRELKFINADATPKIRALAVSTGDIPMVVEWYASHHAGDRYRVFIDGQRFATDGNGHLTEGAVIVLHDFAPASSRPEEDNG